MARKRRTWDVIDAGEVPAGAATFEFTCPNCGREADLPHVGLVLAQIEDGLVFDIGPQALPKEIRCRSCRRIFVN